VTSPGVADGNRCRTVIIRAEVPTVPAAAIQYAMPWLSETERRALDRNQW
jgi:hypothetical protein